MIAKIKAIQILSVTVVCLLLCSVLLSAHTPSGAEKTPETEGVYAVTDIPVSQVAAVTITNATAKFGVMAKGEELEVVSKVQGNYSLTELRSLLYAVSHLSGSKKITELGDGDQYGMGNPSASVVIIKTDGSQLQLDLLNKNPLDDNYYLYSEADQAVYLVSGSVAAMLLRQESDFFSHTVLPVVNGDNYQQLAWIEMDFRGNGRSYRVEQSEGSFMLKQPIVQRVTAVTVMQELLMPVSALYSDRFVETGAELREYGFDQYTLRIRMEFANEEYAALLLDNGDGTCLMADEQSGDIYELTSDSLARLQGDYTELLSGKVFSYSEGNLKSVEVDTGTEHVNLELSAGASKTAETEKKKMGELLAILNDGDISGEISPKEAVEALKNEEAIVMGLTFTLQSGSIDQIDLIPAPQGGYYVSINGVINFTTTESYVQKVRKAVADYQ